MRTVEYNPRERALINKPSGASCTHRVFQTHERDAPGTWYDQLA